VGMNLASLNCTDRELLAWGTGRVSVPDGRLPSEIVDRMPVIA
jgi:hypothetical protein